MDTSSESLTSLAPLHSNEVKLERLATHLTNMQILTTSVTSKKSPIKLPKNDFTWKFNDFDTFTKIA